MQTGDSIAAWRRAWVRASRTLRRDRGVVSAVLLCGGALFFAGTVFLCSAIATELRATILSQTQVSLEILDSAADQDVQSFYAAVRTVRGVEDVKFLPREQALQQERVLHPDLAAFLDRYQLQNPFPDLFLVTLASNDGLEALTDLLREEQWSGLLSPNSIPDLLAQGETVTRVQGIAAAVQRAADAGMVIAGLLLLLLLADLAWARLRMDQGERQTVRLLGGGFAETDGPVLLEIVIVLLVSALTAAGFLAALLLLGPSWIGATDPMLLSFLEDVRGSVFGDIPYLLLFLLCAVPLWALVGMGLARLRSVGRHGTLA